jgi:hypothetical protein
LLLPLTGLEFTTFDYGGHIAIRSIRGLYRSGVAGEVRGHPNGKVKDVLAKDGYAVGGIVVRAGDRVDGFKVVFMRLRGNALDTQDWYESPWLGGPGGDAPMPLACNGRLVVGLLGRSGAEIDAIGLVQAGPRP